RAATSKECGICQTNQTKFERGLRRGSFRSRGGVSLPFMLRLDTKDREKAARQSRGARPLHSGARLSRSPFKQSATIGRWCCEITPSPRSERVKDQGSEGGRRRAGPRWS